MFGQIRGLKESKKSDSDTGYEPEIPSIMFDRNLKATQTEIKIDNIVVTFPYQPYDCQVNYMASVIKSIKTGEFCALESPTGTGKTLSLLCASLAWLSNQRQQQRDNNSFKSEVNVIFYASRTHSQLSNVMKELKKTIYRPRTAILGSRKSYCVNYKIKNKPGSLDTNCRTAIKTKRCEFSKIPANMSDQYNMMDIEELKLLSGQSKLCPFLMQRKKALSADIVFLPYNYIVDKRIRESLKISLVNSILIIDEGHNIDRVLEDVQSCEITLENMSSWINDLKSFAKEISRIGNENNTVKNIELDPIEIIQMIDCSKLEAIQKSILNLYTHIKNLSMGSEKKFNLKELLQLIWTGSTSKNTILEFEPSQQLSNDIDSSGTKNEEDSEVEIKVGSGIGNISEGFKPSQLEDIKKILSLCELYLSEKLQVVSSITNFKDFIEQILELHKNQLLYESKLIPEIDYADNSYKFILNEIEIYAESKFGRKATKSKKLSIFCMNPGFGFKQLSNSKIKTLILTSGTLTPISGFESELKVKFPIKLESKHVIDPKQVKLCLLGRNPKEESMLKGKLQFDHSSKNDSEMMENLGQTIKSFNVITKGGIIVFFTSFKYLDSCYNYWQSTGIIGEIEKKRKIFKDSNNTNIINTEEEEKGSIVNEYRQYALLSSAILLTVCRGSSSEGIDFADNLSRLVIVVGIPYPNIGDIKVKFKREYLRQMMTKTSTDVTGVKKLGESEWYTQSALRAVNQAIGRSIRHIKDYGTVVLIDERYLSMPPTCFSSWTRDSIKKYSNKDIFKDLIHFYSTVDSFIESKYQTIPSLIQPEIKPPTQESLSSKSMISLEVSVDPIHIISRNSSKYAFQNQTDSLENLPKKKKENPETFSKSNIPDLNKNKMEKLKLLNSNKQLNIKDALLNKVSYNGFSKDSTDDVLDSKVILSDSCAKPISAYDRQSIPFISTSKFFVNPSEFFAQTTKLNQTPSSLPISFENHNQFICSQSNSVPDINAMEIEPTDKICVVQSPAVKKKDVDQNNKLLNTEMCLKYLKENKKQINEEELKTESTSHEEKTGLKCSVCFDSNKDFLFAKCGHYLCKECWEKVFAIKYECPVCRAKVSRKHLNKLYLN